MEFLSAEVAIRANSTEIKAALSKVVSDVKTTCGLINSSFSRLTGVMTSPFRAVTGFISRHKYQILALAGAYTYLVREAMKQEQAMERMSIVLRSTGYAAGLSQRQLIEHANALQSTTTYADEAIMELQVLLLTFRNIRGEAFKETTEAALDLAATMGGDLRSAAIQVGKAMNDPATGAAMLRRVGVSLSEQQIEQIKHFQSINDLASAQRIILDELKLEFGGMASNVSTTSGTLKQMWNALGEVSEAIGFALLPGLKRTAEGIKKWAEDNKASIATFAEKAAIEIGFIIDVFWELAKFMTTDFVGAVKYAANILGLVFKATFVEVERLFAAFMLDMVRTAEGMGLKISGAILDALTVSIQKHEATWKGLAKEIEAVAPPRLAPRIAEAGQQREEDLTRLAREGPRALNLGSTEMPTRQGTVEGLQETADQMKQIFGDVADYAKRAFSSIEGSMTDNIQGMLEGTQSFKEGFIGIMGGIQSAFMRMISEMIARWIMFQALTGMGLDAGVLLGIGQPTGAAGQTAMPVMEVGEGHIGGIVGVTHWPMRRLHQGLQNDEFPAILQKGEIVIPKNQTGSTGGITPTIIIQAIDTQTGVQFLMRNEKSLAAVVGRIYRNNNPLRRQD